MSSISSPVQRIGDILCHDQTLAAAMLFPQHSSLVLASPQPPPSLVASDRALLSDPASILFVLDDQSSAHRELQITAFLRAALPPPPALATVSHHSPPISLLAWKLEAPARIIAYTGTQEQLASADLTRPHTIGPKLQLSQRSKRPTPASITVMPPTGGELGDLVRSSLLQLQTAPQFKETLTASIRKKGRQPSSQSLQSHTLEEAVACFVRPPPAHGTTTVQLGASAQWTRDYINCRSRLLSLLQCSRMFSGLPPL